MGYELHIVRLYNYDDVDEESNISLEEWLAYVARDEELELTNGYTIKIPGFGNSSQYVPGYCNWLGYPKSDAGYLPWFDWGCGCVSTKNADKYTVKKMLQIAVLLNARVRGDDGEYYDEETLFTDSGSPIAANWSPGEEIPALNLLTKKPWWKFW